MTLLLSFAPACLAQACPPPAAKQAADRAAAIRAKLLSFAVGEMYTSVPAELQQQIGEFKDALASTADEYIRCQKPDVDAKVVEKNLTAALNASRASGEAEDHPYGSELAVVVKRPDEAPGLLTVEVTFGIECGRDTILLVYEHNNTAWKRAVRWQSAPYAEVSGAFGDFFNYLIVNRAVSPPWVVAVAHGHPWCTSRFSGFNVDVVEPAHDGQLQHSLLHKEYGYLRGDIEPSMKARPAGFELRVQEASIDMDITERIGIYRYSLNDDEVRREQPIAMNGRDFVDEWLQSDWEDASRWSEAVARQQLQSEHQRIAKARHADGKDLTGFEYGAVRGCSGDPKLFQVELDETPGKPTYFLIHQGNNSFTTMGASHTASPRCSGPNIMPKK
jgi:hypothetical protein